MRHKIRAFLAWGLVAAAAYGCAQTRRAFAEDLVLHDAARNRDIPVRIFRPLGKQHVPIVIFSHGNGGGKSAAPYLGKYMSAHGYVEIHPQHQGSDRGTPSEELATAMDRPEQWQERVQDIRFVLDSLPKIAPQADRTRIALAGHSYGAFTVMLMAGAVPKIVRGRDYSFTDPRIKAFVAISPQGVRPSMDELSWKSIESPILYIAGSEDAGARGERPAWRLGAYKLTPGPDTYLLYFTGAHHLTFAIPRVGKFKLQAVYDYLPPTVDTFLKAYLKSDPKAKKSLLTDTLSERTGGKVELRHK